MKNCPNCGKAWSDNELFCGDCGAKLDEQVSPAESVSDAENPASPGEGCIFCPVCGEALEDSAVFCSNCGARIAAAPKKGKFKPSKKAVIIFAAAFIVVIAGVVIAALNGAFMTQGQKFLLYQLNMLSSRYDAESSVMYNADDSLSTDITVTANSSDELLNGILSDSSAKVKIDAGNNRLIMNMLISISGEEPISAAFTAEENSVGFYLPAADDTYYTMDAETYLGILKELGVELQTEDMQNDPDMAGIFKTYFFDVLSKAVSSDSLEIERGEKYELPQLGGEYKGTVYTFTPSADDIEIMLDALCTRMNTDDDLALLLDYIVPTLNNTYSGYSRFSDGADLLDYLIDYIDDNSSDIADAVEDADISWRLYLDGSEVRMIEVEVGSEDYAAVFEFDGDNSDGSVLFYVKNTDDDSVEFSIKYDYSADGDIHEGKIVISDVFDNAAATYLPGQTSPEPTDGSEDLVLSYEYDAGERSAIGFATGSFKLVGNDKELISFTVSGDKDSADHVLVIHNITFNGFGMERLEMSINTTGKSTAEIPDADKKDLSGSDLEDIEDIFGGYFSMTPYDDMPISEYGSI